MKKTPVTVKELDVQPLSDEDLREFSQFGAAASSSDWWLCVDRCSDWWGCIAES